MFTKVRTTLERPATLDLARFLTDRRVLDVGCGPSFAQSHLRFDPAVAAEFVGLDTFLPFLAHARQENPAAHLTFAQASLTALPFPDRSFDTVLALFVLHHVPGDPVRLLAELARVARTHVIVFDHVKAERGLVRRGQDLYWRLIDGGCRYMTASHWERCLAAVGLAREFAARSGPFGQVVRMVLRR
jgi:ubiquinone/menaquinone biosynthesis C-methylase UbiE